MTVYTTPSFFLNNTVRISINNPNAVIIPECVKSNAVAIIYPPNDVAIAIVIVVKINCFCFFEISIPIDAGMTNIPMTRIMPKASNDAPVVRVMLIKNK